MFDALIGGKLHKQPVQRTGKNGQVFVTCKVKVTQQDGSIVFVNVICFDAASCTALMALTEGDAVGLSGSLTLKTWQDGQGQVHPAADLVASAVLSAYAVRKKRKAATGGDSHENT